MWLRESDGESPTRPPICGSPATRSSYFFAMCKYQFKLEAEWCLSARSSTIGCPRKADEIRAYWTTRDITLCSPSIRTFLLYCFISLSWFISFSSWFMLLNVWSLPLELIVCFLAVLFRDRSRRLHLGRNPFSRTFSLPHYYV